MADFSNFKNLSQNIEDYRDATPSYPPEWGPQPSYNDLTRGERLRNFVQGLLGSRPPQKDVPVWNGDPNMGLNFAGAPGMDFDLSRYISAARPAVASAVGKVGRFSSGGPLGAMSSAVSTMYPYVSDSNFPDVAGNRAAHAAQRRQGVGFSGTLTPQDRINEAFGSLPSQDNELAAKFAALLRPQQAPPDMAPQPPVQQAPQAPQLPMPAPQTPMIGGQPQDPSMLQRFFQSIYDNVGHPGPAPTGPNVGPFPR